MTLCECSWPYMIAWKYCLCEIVAAFQGALAGRLNPVFRILQVKGPARQGIVVGDDHQLRKLRDPPSCSVDHATGSRGANVRRPYGVPHAAIRVKGRLAVRYFRDALTELAIGDLQQPIVLRITYFPPATQASFTVARRPARGDGPWEVNRRPDSQSVPVSVAKPISRQADNLHVHDD
ncbi:uncharacterized protein CIMG_13550 [Coccidioides immitis RS]|uniref:Uncharacterized protein n=1 Tax=Coccidioides immitis (strain RS) TaxID=246410 RepID=A0A0D8JWF2_COCIM|nr:uncharacterized protein CIMG_13550 [Coccidioides immitis RS]KJF61261.1 hypothetical protein CIMG_13550 [Coccidioides immitis RS]